MSRIDGADLHGHFALIEPQIGLARSAVRPVATEAGRGKDRPNIAIEFDIRRATLGRQKATGQQGQAERWNPNPKIPHRKRLGMGLRESRDASGRQKTANRAIPTAGRHAIRGKSDQSRGTA